ncbi:hypothetical protein PVA45_08340 (plasmid) [Entomospira entomophila]|uniref:Uncharacterized protein n=1 Tax=Entomospira entomophila TaxID=2719988 RepID=A0A968KS77_9SPIO|nr:hypothetical protein [Entomospira entomophilus]NIZ41533.1 hypothetical protein [Entomospira entomophilus]WDI36439.1 hypothetical protein PVA45_08340 [Entomospira entomophilus]
MSHWQAFGIGLVSSIMHLLVGIVLMRLLLPEAMKRIKHNIFIIFRDSNGDIMTFDQKGNIIGRWKKDDAENE